LTWISPRSPSGTSREGSSGSASRIWVSGNGTPTCPAFRVRFTGLPAITGAVSDSPYPSMRRPPVAASHFSISFAGSGIAPLMPTRDPRSDTPWAAAASATFSNTGGTAITTVGTRRL